MNDRKTILITGCSSGFGRTIAETMARKGYQVFASMRNANTRNADARDELLALATREKLKLDVIDLDVTDDDSVDRAVAGIIADAGRIDILVNNAGYAVFGLTETFTIEQAKRIFDTNFFGIVRMNRAVLPQMRRQRQGLIVHITSAGGRGVLPGMGLYAATKFAAEALAECYRYELSQAGIDSITVEPGPYRTEIFGKGEAAADLTRAREYGGVADVPGQIAAALESSDLPAQDVADEVARLIETPAGSRPMRTLIGPMVAPLQPINDVSAQIQNGLLTGMGLGHLMSVAAQTKTQPA
jgi:NAD(P)-dependent dehydrogenase (short-subunit alcohol dehydrogenase family)